MLDHLPKLVVRIDTNRDFAQDIFGDDFQTLDRWVTYWSKRQNAVSPLFAKEGARWTPADFQTLFVACWLHCPVEKGSYMIPVPLPARQATLRAAMAQLPERWSSHLSRKGARSAGQGYAFLNGYSELLIQFEDSPPVPQLFLKTEGHPAASVAHIGSYVHKVFFNEGMTASRRLHEAAAMGTDGIQLRAAENYDGPYQALMKHLGMTGILHTVEEALPAICRKLQQKAPVPASAVLAEVELAGAVGAPLNKTLLARLIREVILPTLRQPDLAAGQFIAKLKEAAPTLATLADGLDADAGDIRTATVPRVFQEVRVTVEQLDQTVTQVLKAIQNWRWRWI